MTLNAYFMLLGIGFGFYMYEYTFFQSWQKGVIAYIILFTWIALNRFLFRPCIIRKRKRHFADLVKNVEELKFSFNE